MPAYHDRQYVAYLVLGDPTSKPLWQWTRWLEFSQLFDPVLKICRDRALVRVTQFTKEQKKDVLKFGRLAWNPASFAKWAHGSPATGEKSNNWEFLSAEVSAPSVPTAWREGRPPDFFLVVANEAVTTKNVPLAFNPRIFAAIAADMPPEALSMCREAVEKSTVLVASRLSATINRPWGYAFGSSGAFQSAIQDVAHIGLFKVGQQHLRPLNLDTLSEKWEPL